MRNTKKCNNHIGDNMNCYEIIGRNLKRLRKEKGLYQIDIATILEIKQPYYSQLETGTKEISIEQLIKIADEFELPLDYFTERLQYKSK